jgi:hypothetical protein
MRDKIRNYMIGFIELGLDLDPIYQHFAEFTTQEHLDEIAMEALHDGVSSPASPNSVILNAREESRSSEHPNRT